MPIRSKSIRLLRLLGKTLLILLTLLLLLLIGIHIPAFQQILTRKVASTLSSRLHSEVQIEKIRFSLLGHMEVTGLSVEDPSGQPVLHAGTIRLEARTPDLLQGHWILQQAVLKDISFNLTQSDTGLNITYILNAFTSDKPAPAEPSPFDIQCHGLQLENVGFTFTSLPDDFKLTTSVSEVHLDSIGYATVPDRIHAASIFVNQPDIYILQTAHADIVSPQEISKPASAFIPDFGLSIAIAAGKLELTNGEFGFDYDSIMIPLKFDPGHIHLQEIHAHLGRTVMSRDMLLTVVDSLTLDIPGYGKQSIRATASMNPKSLSIDGLLITSAGHILDGVIKANYVSRRQSPDTLFQGDGELIGTISTPDLAYFLGDDIMAYLKDFTTVGVAVSGGFSRDYLALESVTLSTDQSRITGMGLLENFMTPQQLSWKDFKVNALVGHDLRKSINSLSGNIPLPPSITAEVTSTGHPNRMLVDGKINTTWGSLQSKGMVFRTGKNLSLDMQMTGQNIVSSHWTDLAWIGPVNASLQVQGVIGTHPDIQAEGEVTSITLYDKPIYDITLSARYAEDTLIVNAWVKDTNYTCQITSATALLDTLTVNANVQFNTFHAGLLLGIDSSLLLKGNLATSLKIKSDEMSGKLTGNTIELQSNAGQYALDSLHLQAALSKDATHLSYLADDARLDLDANFDLREGSGYFSKWPGYALKHPDSLFTTGGTRLLTATGQLENDSVFQFLGFRLDTFSGLTFNLDFNEPDSTMVMASQSGKLSSYGLTTDSIHAEVRVRGHSSEASASMTNLVFNKPLGNLSLQLHTPGDTITSNLVLQRDTSIILGLDTRLITSGQVYQIYPDNLQVIGTAFHVDPTNPIVIDNGNILLKDFAIGHDDMHLQVSGDSTALDMTFDHVNLTRLNDVLFPDSAVIHKADLNGHMVFVEGKHLDIEAAIDSLMIYDSKPFSLSLTANTDLNEIPFAFLLTGESNKLQLEGKYLIDAGNVNAKLNIDIPQAETFAFLAEDYLDALTGHLHGTALITGPLDQPDLDGKLYFRDMDIRMKDSGLYFGIPDDSIAFSHNELRLDSFRLFDRGGRPLKLTGTLHTPDYSAYDYDLKVQTEKYALMDNASDPEAMIKGLLMLGTDTRISGNNKDTYVNADLTIQDTTNLIYTYPSSGSELTQTQGIIEFVDPSILADTSTLAASGGTYDSLIALLPDFILQSKINIEDKAKLKIIVDSQSGDYLEASGGGKLDMGYDRTGNLNLSGTYTVVNGIYRLSFYNLVKKNFTIVPGSSITWSGNPRGGALSIKAAYKVSSNSIGLIGNEIGENEKSTYKRSLEYEIGIHIEGTLEKPNVYFTLDLPDQEKANYPVLANKLDRLTQPEFQSELNKQVFGLLVLGGFLPESSGADINSNQVATTALYNSVNSVLAAQLNRFAGQHLKGINIDVGIQSYSDYSTPGSKTQTAMDFRVSKSVLDDRLSFEVGGDFDISTDQSGSNTGNNYRGDVAIIYDLTGNGDKKLKLFNNESYDIVYQEIRNTGISLIFIREFNKGEGRKKKNK